MEKVEKKSIFSILFSWKKGKTLFGSKLKFFVWLQNEVFLVVCGFVLWRRMGQKVYNFFSLFIHLLLKDAISKVTVKTEFKKHNNKVKIFFLREDFSFFEMNHLIDICAGGERLTFIHATLARWINSIESKALQIDEIFLRDSIFS